MQILFRSLNNISKAAAEQPYFFDSFLNLSTSVCLVSMVHWWFLQADFSGIYSLVLKEVSSRQIISLLRWNSSTDSHRYARDFHFAGLPGFLICCQRLLIRPNNVLGRLEAHRLVLERSNIFKARPQDFTFSSQTWNSTYSFTQVSVIFSIFLRPHILWKISNSILKDIQLLLFMLPSETCLLVLLDLP